LAVLGAKKMITVDSCAKFAFWLDMTIALKPNILFVQLGQILEKGTKGLL